MANLLDIKTINDEEDVEYYSEDSDPEIEFQPTKQKDRKQAAFSGDFNFLSTSQDYNQDVWNDLTKYVKRKAKFKTDDKIKRAVMKMNQNTNGIPVPEEINDGDKSDISLSDDELKFDNLKTKAKKTKKKQPSNDYFEQPDENNQEVNSFYEMNLSRPLMKAISEMKFIHPTPIQASTIPLALLGKDICGCAATGTGKTAAYMLPTLERLIFRPIETAVSRVLVLVPTRELGVQVYQVSKQLAQFTDIEIGLAVGGLDLKTQENILRKNPDVVIATPGRLIDHLKSTPTFSLDSIEVLILDEADRMLDEYFEEQMKEIIKQCNRSRQTMLFSATMTSDVEELAAVSLNRPVKLFVDSNRQVAFNLRQEFVRIRQDKESDREALLAALVCRTFRTHCIVFVQTKKQAHRLHILLGLCNCKVVELHGNLTQPQRLEALAKFKNCEADILIATDVAARGLDIVGVQTVINYSMPNNLEQYIHRVGRTARAGRAGVSVSLAGESERKIVKDIIKRANKPVKSRLIPPDIVEKYKVKLEKLEPEIMNILQEEKEERLLSKAENQANRAQRILNGDVEQERPWFQTKQERKDEKKKLSVDNSNKEKKKKKREVEVDKEADKIALLQAKRAKKEKKSKRINSCVEDKIPNNKNAPKKGRKSYFHEELTDTSAKGAKMLRYNAQASKKMKERGFGNKASSFGKNSKSTNGKSFGKNSKGTNNKKGTNSKSFGKNGKSFSKNSKSEGKTKTGKTFGKPNRRNK